MRIERAVQDALKIKKIAWIIGSSDYDQFRKLEGCSRLQDLPAIHKDLRDVLRLVDSMMIPNDSDHRIICINPTFKQLQKAYTKVLKKWRDFNDRDEPLFLFVYFGGHGVAHK